MASSFLGRFSLLMSPALVHGGLDSADHRGVLLLRIVHESGKERVGWSENSGQRVVGGGDDIHHGRDRVLGLVDEVRPGHSVGDGVDGLLDDPGSLIDEVGSLIDEPSNVWDTSVGHGVNGLLDDPGSLIEKPGNALRDLIDGGAVQEPPHHLGGLVHHLVDSSRELLHGHGLHDIVDSLGDSVGHLLDWQGLHDIVDGLGDGLDSGVDDLSHGISRVCQKKEVPLSSGLSDGREAGRAREDERNRLLGEHGFNLQFVCLWSVFVGRRAP
mmetsp:Transcript_9771/g.29716  ORF Transcript_9771/g.29716 Transcript_9771/m.29716 type:complete len:270 (-) Transcript_9771:22-831(-)